MAHVRRRSSSRVGPSPALGHPAYSDVLPSPFIGRTPEWSAQTTGVGVGSRPQKQGWIDSSKSPRPAAQKSSAISRPGAESLPPLRDVVVRFLSILLRLLRTPQGLVIAATTIVLCSTSAYVRAHSDELAARPVHPSLFPLIRHSGNVVHFVSPKLGARIKDWHDYQVENDPNRPPSREELERGSRHTFHPNGLLLVNPKGRHPIHVLIDRAEKKWKEKVERQSRTLSEAVREYKHRYRRNPPKGFDDWWRFCEENNVQLRDEYDQINHDLAPHWALEGHDSRHRNRVMQERDHTFTIAMRPGEPAPTIHGPYAHIKRASDIADMLALFTGRMHRPLNITYIIDDNPAVMLPHAQRERMVELGSQGEYFGPSEFLEGDDPSLSNFAQACAPNSPLRRSERGEHYTDYSGDTVRSFVWNHAKVMDLCQHPEARKLHGHTMQQGVPLGPLVPLFAFAKTRLHADILAVPIEQWEAHYVGYEPPWEGKTMNKVLWRGSTTGVEFNRHTPWRRSQRARLHIMSHETEGTQNIIWSRRGQLREANMSVAAINDHYMDTSFSGALQQCDPETCELLEKKFDIKPTIGLDESNTYKYLFDVDGNGWSGRFHRLMSTRSVVLKSTAFPEWYQDRIQEWVHYVPIKVDYSDVYDVMAFFVGMPNGQGSHDSLAQKIGEAGRQWAKDYWRYADMAAYMYRLSLEYVRILHHDEGDVDYVEMPSFNL
ncbi:glycosyltransferase family 90 protein [Rhodotorula sp. JG-1b]|nr:glycosyltransferase family 90 protein [Rhodotorula sp. JG-1b]